MSWDDLKKIQQNGMGIDSHGLSHCTLAADNPNRITKFFKPTLDLEQGDDIDQKGCLDFGLKTKLNIGQVRTELRDSKKALHDNLGVNVRAIAYPFGNYNQQVVDLSRQDGYDIGYTTDIPTESEVDIDKPMEIARYHVFGQQDGHLTGFFAQ